MSPAVESQTEQTDNTKGGKKSASSVSKYLSRKSAIIQRKLTVTSKTFLSLKNLALPYVSYVECVSRQ